MFGINQSASHDELDFPQLPFSQRREQRQVLRLYHAKVTQTKSGTGTGSSCHLRAIESSFSWEPPDGAGL